MRGTRSKFTDGSGRGEREPSKGQINTGRLVVLMLVGMAAVVVVISALLPETDSSPPGDRVIVEPSGSPSSSEWKTPRSSRSPSPSPSRSRTRTPSPSATPDEDKTPKDDRSPDDESSASDKKPSAAEVAGRFVDAWLTKGTAEEREKALAPWATTDLVNGLTVTDTARIPDAERVGRSETDRGDHYAVYLIALSNDEKVVVTVVADGEGGWEASEVKPEEES